MFWKNSLVHEYSCTSDVQHNGVKGNIMGSYALGSGVNDICFVSCRSKGVWAMIRSGNWADTGRNLLAEVGHPWQRCPCDAELLKQETMHFFESNRRKMLLLTSRALKHHWKSLVVEITFQRRAKQLAEFWYPRHLSPSSSLMNPSLPPHIRRILPTLSASAFLQGQQGFRLWAHDTVFSFFLGVGARTGVRGYWSGRE